MRLQSLWPRTSISRCSIEVGDALEQLSTNQISWPPAAHNTRFALTRKASTHPKISVSLWIASQSSFKEMSMSKRPQDSTRCQRSRPRNERVILTLWRGSTNQKPRNWKLPPVQRTNLRLLSNQMIIRKRNTRCLKIINALCTMSHLFEYLDLASRAFSVHLQ